MSVIDLPPPPVDEAELRPFDHLVEWVEEYALRFSEESQQRVLDHQEAGNIKTDGDVTAFHLASMAPFFEGLEEQPIPPMGVTFVLRQLEDLHPKLKVFFEWAAKGYEAMWRQQCAEARRGEIPPRRLHTAQSAYREDHCENEKIAMLYLESRGRSIESICEEAEISPSTFQCWQAEIADLSDERVISALEWKSRQQKQVLAEQRYEYAMLRKVADIM